MQEIVIVTGASSGIGAATARLLGAAGAHVVVNYNSSKELAEGVVADVEKVGGKAIAVQANMGSEADILRLFEVADKAFGTLTGEFKVPGPVLPFILTTSGTGSEVTPVAVVTDPDRAVKVGIASPHIISHTAICDPELTHSCPSALTAVSGADALTHAIEAFTTMRRQPTGSIVHEHIFLGKNALSDNYALMAVSHIAAILKRAVDNGADREARERLMLGATMAGLAFGTAGTAVAHAVQYPIGAMTHTPHGAGVAVMMPYVMEFNRTHCEPELAEIGRAMGLDLNGRTVSEQASAAIEAVENLFTSIGVPKTIADLGIVSSQLGLVAEQAMGSARLIKNNPRPIDLGTMANLVEAAFARDRARLRATFTPPALPRAG